MTIDRQNGISSRVSVDQVESFRISNTRQIFGHMSIVWHVYMGLRTSVDTCQTIDMWGMFYMCFQMRKLSIENCILAKITGPRSGPGISVLSEHGRLMLHFCANQSGDFSKERSAEFSKNPQTWCPADVPQQHVAVPVSTLTYL